MAIDRTISVDKMAEIAHEVNRAYCLAIGDDSQVAWADAPDWQKGSARNGVKLHVENPDTTPEESHAAWLQEKLNDGWVYGEVKNVDKKEHPCCVPYEDLDINQKAKDHIFKAIIRMLTSI